ncbi:MAG: hypothetical protein IKA36_07305 [Clostridia bacterium]|nr:hypothetical protein [Clostridia bacterium]
MSTKTFDNVKVKVAFTAATTRANIITGENISTMFGKLSKWYTSFNDVVWTGDADTVSGFTVGANVPADAKFTDTVYTHPTTAGNKHIPSGGASGQILKWSSSGTAKWASEYSYTHPTSGVTAGTYRSVTVDANGHVTGGSNPTLTVAQGGTGGTTPNAAAFNLIGDPVVSETALSDDIKFAFYYATPSTSNGALYAKKASSVWTYIKGKADTVYAPKSHTHSISNITNLQTTLDSKLNASLKGVASGLAELDSSGKVPSSQLPSYVDDVIEGYLSSGKFYKESSHTTQITGESGKIYLDLSTAKVYRWSGSSFVIVSDYTHPTSAGNKHIPAGGSSGQFLKWSAAGTATWSSVTKSDVGLGNVENKSSATIRGELTKANVTTALGYTPPTQDTVYTHPTYTAKTGVPTANQTPAFGGTFTVTQPVSDATGHITAMNSRTITIPATAMTGATASAAGTKGLVPAPAKGKQDTFLRGDGTWVAPLRQTVMNQPSSTPTETPWFKVASATLTTTSAHIFLTLAVSSGMVGTQVGILHVKVATGTTVGTNMSATAKWLNPTGIELGDFVLTYTETADTSVKYELWCKLDRQWRTYIFSVINEGSRTTADIRWDLEEDKTAGVATYGTPTGVVESSYISNDSPAKMTENTADSEQYVFFNDSTVDGTLGYDPKFTYNPSKNTILITNPGGTRTTKYSGQGVAINTDSNTTWANGINYYTADGSTQLAALGAYGTADMTSAEFDESGYLYMGKTYSNPWLKVAKSLSSMYSDFVISKTTPVLTINSGGSTEASIVLKRDGSSWRIMDTSNGVFKIQNNWDHENKVAIDWEDVFSFSTDNKARFENTVTAPTFIGALDGNAKTATTASKLSNTSAIGSATNPVYFNASGVPVKTTYTLGKSVPSDAVFTDINVKQHTTNASNYRPLVFGYTNSSDPDELIKDDGSSVTGQVYVTNKIYAKASTGELYAIKFNGSGAGLTDVPSTALPVVPITKGGTGATDAATARTNLGITPANIGAAASSHGEHVEFSTSVPKANGTAAVGTATTVSRSDHVHPLQTSVSGNAGTATKLKTAVKIDGFSFDGSASINHYATCSTAAATVAKVATINTGTFTLATGATVYVKFTNANTATSATLNVNSTGAKPIFHNGAAISASSYIKAGGVYQFVYDGTNWVINAGVDTNTVYTHPVTAGNKHIPSGGSSGQILKWSSDGTATWATEYSYTHPTTAGNKHIPSGGSSGQILRWSAAGTAVWGDDNNTDVNVKQVSTSAANYRPLVLGYSNNADSSQLVGEDPVTNQVYVNNSLYAKASTGELFATKFNGSGAGLTSLNASNLSSGTVPFARIPTGTSSTTVALGNHTHSNYYSTSTSRTANTVLAAPNGSDGTASFRKLVAADLPTSGATAGTYGESAAKTATHGGTISIPKITIDNKGRVTSASSITVTLPSDNNTDTKVTSTTTNPTSAKSYYPTFVTGATTGGVSINNGLQYQSLEGTTSADGYGILKLGNPTASGTAANKYGRLDIFSIGTSYGSIKQTSTNSAVTHWLPDVGGTLLNSGNYLNYKGHLRQNVMNQSSSTPTSTPWFKIASMTLEGASSHAFGTFAIANGMSAGDVGILHVKVATGSTAGTNLSATARWISKTRIDPSTFVVTYTETANTSVKYELWCKLTNQWRTYITSIINEGSRTQANIVWELSEDTTAGSATYGTPTGFSESAHTIDEGPMATTSNSANSEQTIFFNDSTVDGTLGYDSSLVFNPSTNTIYVTNPGGTRRSGYGGNGMSIRADSSTTWACGVNYYTSDGATQIGAIGAYGVANATEAGYLYMGKTYSNPWLKVAEDQITGYADTVISKATPTLTLNSGGSTPPTIVLKRNGSSWRVMNESGAFVLKCDWDAANSTTTDWWQAFKISTSGAISGNGSGLTNLNASNITSGTLSSDRLPTVPITKGGTGGTTANAAAFNLIGDPVVSETAIADTTKLAFYYATPSTSNGALYAKPASTLWTYIEPKIEAAYQPLKKKTVTLPATAGWYRIASSWEGINRCHGIFTIEGTVSGRHTTATFTAQSSYGNANSTAITVLTASQYGNSAISKVRIVYHTTYSGNYAYLEVYNPAAAATKVTTNIDSSIGWQLIDVVAGSIPSGYSNKEVTLSNNTMVATTFSGTASKVTSAMAAPTTSTSYGIAFHTGNTAGSKSLLNNAGIRCAVANGVAGATDPGLGYIYLGNNKATGTADNQKGGILMYSDTTYAGYITAPGLTARRDYALPNASGTIALTSTANMVKQADLDVRYNPETQTTNNTGLRLPLAIGSKNTNPDNNFKDGEGQREINIETGNFGINLTGLAWIETNTTSGNVGTPNVPYATICSTGFRVTDNDIGGFYGNATSATTLKNQPKINGVTFAGDNNISLGKVLYEGFTINADGSITDNNGTDTSVDLNDDPMNYDALYVETYLGAFWVIPKDEIVNAAFTYATTPNPGGNSTAVYGTVSIYVNGMELSSTVSKSRMTGSTSSVTAASVTVNNTIRRVIGLHLV